MWLLEFIKWNIHYNLTLSVWNTLLGFYNMEYTLEPCTLYQQDLNLKGKFLAAGSVAITTCAKCGFCTPLSNKKQVSLNIKYFKVH